MDPAPGDILFLDTNILLSATDRGRREYESAGRLLRDAPGAGIHLAVSGQVLREYLVVATRPRKVNGLGLSPADAHANVAEFSRRTLFYSETEPVSARLRELALSQSLSGTRLHDANIAATMHVHGLRFLCTLNPDDYRTIPGIRILSLPLDL